MSTVRRSVLFALAAGLGVALVGDRAGAYTFFSVNGSPVVWAGGESVRYLSPSTFSPNSATDVLYLGAMGLWNIVPASTFQYSFARNEQDFPIDHFDGFSDTIAVAADSLDPGTLGLTFLVNSGSQWFDMDQVFADFPNNVGWSLDPDPNCTAVANPQVFGYSFLLAATHELGHALGLGHDPVGNEPAGAAWFVATMNPAYPAGGPVGDNNIVELHTDDRSGVRFLYPHSGPSAPPLVDLALADFAPGPVLGKSEPLGFDPSRVLPDGELTLTSVIENFGSTNEFFVRQGFYLSDDTTIDTSDLLLGEIRWDLAFEDAIEFDATVTMPADLAAGTYFLGSILDDLDEVTEEFEDNNTHRYCATLEVGQLPPVIEPLGQDAASCGQRYVGARPSVTKPLNMGPLTWRLENPPTGMIINANTGVIRWPDPIPSPFLYAIVVRATNGAGSATDTLFLGVNRALPQIEPIADEQLACGENYVGPLPVLTDADCMAPILTWALDSGPAGMTIDFATGRVSWASAVPSASAYQVTVRAVNSEGSGSQSWLLSVATINGDLDFDGSVGLSDLSIVLSSFGSCSADSGYEARADLDGSGCVELADLAELLALFGTSCP